MYRFESNRILNTDGSGFSRVQNPASVISHKGKKKQAGIATTKHHRLLRHEHMFLFPRLRMAPSFIQSWRSPWKYLCVLKIRAQEQRFVRHLTHKYLVSNLQSSIQIPKLPIMHKHTNVTSLSIKIKHVQG